MGVQIKDILEYDEITLNSLANKKIAIDTFNMLYQFLATIRQPDGTPLTDRAGKTTSHLKGLFNRCVYFKKNNIKPVFVFDGKSPKLKEKEQKLRAEKKILADKKYKEALELGYIEEARKFASAVNKLEPEMLEDAKKLIRAFGFPIVEAPSEGEAQASYLASKGEVWAAASQDFDSLLFGSRYLVKNLSISNKRKVAGSSVYREIPIEFYDLKKNLDRLGITRSELILIAILCGTDFNVGGIKGIGPKKALKLVKDFRGREDELFKNLDWYSYFPYTWNEVYNTFKKMPVEENAEIKFEPIDKLEIEKLLISKDFDEVTIKRSLNGIKNTKTLDSFF